MTTLRIATRGSALALTQAHWVAARLSECHPEVATELVIVKTEGDLLQNRPLSVIGGRGVFVRAIEERLLAGDADLAVHSLKDMPSELPAGLTLAAVPEREDPHDVLVMRRDEARASPPLLPHGARVGTSGPRRRALLRRERPDLQIAEVRGNLDTRLRKLDAGEYDALVLAAAGLRRLGLETRISLRLPLDTWTPAVGQGALGVEARADAADVLALLSALEHPPTRACVTAERAAQARLRGGCTAPFGAHATCSGDMLLLRGILFDPTGERAITRTLSGSAADPAALGARLAEALLADGAEAFLRHANE